MNGPMMSASSLVALLWSAQGECCFLCGDPMFKVAGDAFVTSGWTREHLYPRCSTGRGMSNNIVLSHWRCNAERGNQQPSHPELAAARALYASFGMIAFIESAEGIVKTNFTPRNAWAPKLGDLIGTYKIRKVEES